MRAGLGLAAALALGCNAILGITDTSSLGDSPPDGGAATLDDSPCANNGECLDRTGENAPSACIAKRCVALLSPECPVLLPKTNRLWLDNLRHSEPDPVIFGAFVSTPTTLYGNDALNYDLVLTEVTNTVGGLPTADGKQRPVLALGCKQLPDSIDELNHAIDHLVLDLKVPGILAGLEASDLAYAFRRQGYANHVFFMSPFDADRTIAGLDDDGLVWEMLSGGEDLAPTYQPLLDLALGYQIRKGQLAANEPARVALVTTDNVSALSALSGALTAGILRINGRPARDNEPDYFRAISITSSTLATTPPDYSDAIGMLRDFAPHVIIGIATSEFTGAIMPALEALQQDTEPFYLLSPWHVEGSLLKSLEQRHPDIYLRMAGVNYAAAADPTIYDDYQNRFDAANPAVHGATGLENYYDAGYYLIYSAAAAVATAAAAATPLSGSNLADGMQRLLSGPPTFSVGPDDLKPAFAALAAPASSIALNGAMGPPNFDPRSGSRHEPGSVFCVDGKGNLFTDVLRLDDNGELEGSFPCFDLIAP